MKKAKAVRKQKRKNPIDRGIRCDPNLSELDFLDEWEGIEQAAENNSMRDTLNKTQRAVNKIIEMIEREKGRPDRSG